MSESDRIDLKLKLRSFNSSAIDMTITSILRSLLGFNCKITGPIPLARGVGDFNPEKPLQFDKKVKHNHKLCKRARQDRLIIIQAAPRDIVEVLKQQVLRPGVGMEINISINNS